MLALEIRANIDSSSAVGAPFQTSPRSLLRSIDDTPAPAAALCIPPR